MYVMVLPFQGCCGLWGRVGGQRKIPICWVRICQACPHPLPQGFKSSGISGAKLALVTPPPLTLSLPNPILLQTFPQAEWLPQKHIGRSYPQHFEISSSDEARNSSLLVKAISQNWSHLWPGWGVQMLHIFLRLWLKLGPGRCRLSPAWPTHHRRMSRTPFFFLGWGKLYPQNAQPLGLGNPHHVSQDSAHRPPTRQPHWPVWRQLSPEGILRARRFGLPLLSWSQNPGLPCSGGTRPTRPTQSFSSRSQQNHFLCPLESEHLI